MARMNDEMLYNGKPLSGYSKEELIEIIKKLVRKSEIDQMRHHRDIEHIAGMEVK